MQSQINQCPVNQRRKTFSGTVLTALLILGGMAVNYSEVPKAALYSVFREVNKYSIALQTRNWSSLRGSHFEIRFKPEDAGIAQMVLDTAEAAVVPVNEMLGYSPKDPALVLVYPTRGELGKSFGWTGDQSAMGVYWAGIIRVLSPTAWIEGVGRGEVEKAFRSSGPMVHEYAHLVVDYITRGNYPRWLTEGIAQYIEREITGFSFAEDPGFIRDKWFSLSELEKSFDTPEGQAPAYSQSLAMMDYLTQEYGEDAFLGILERLGKGQSLNKAWREETGVSLQDFEGSFVLWSQTSGYDIEPAM